MADPRRWRAAAGALLLVLALAGLAGPAGSTPVGQALPAPVAQAGPEPLAPPPVDPDRARRAAERITRQPEYQGPKDQVSLIERFRRWLRKHLPHTSRKATGPRRTLGDPFAYLVIALVAGLAIFAIVRTVGRTRREGKPHDEGEVDEGEVEVTPLRSVDEWLREAERLESEGAWREALRARYRSLTGTLVQRDVLDDLPGRTPGEQRVVLGERAPEASATFDTLSSEFEASWFGRRPTGPEDVARFRSGATEVLDRTATRRRAATSGEGDDARPVAVRAIDAPEEDR